MKRERIGLARMALGLVLVCAAPQWAAAQSAQPAAAACESLKAAAIPATAIALATNGAKAVSVTYVAAAGTRPLCQYPSWPKYKGSGDVDQASSFVCARS